MQGRVIASGLMVLAATVAVSPLRAGRASDPPQFADMATAQISDLEATVKVLRSEPAELRKINRDFGLAYKFGNVLMRYKRPDKLRLEGHLANSPALYVVNGSTRFYSVPPIIKGRKDDLGESPGKHYSLIEVGLISKDELAATNGKYLRTESVDDKPCYVFDVTYKGDDGPKYVLWVDPKTHVVAKREWYDSDGHLRATFRYLDVQEIRPGTWMPTRMEVRNGEGTIAGVTTYAGLKVNQGISDTYFEIS